MEDLQPLARSVTIVSHPTVEAMQESMDLSSYARVEDIDHLHDQIDDLTDDLEGVLEPV